MKTEELICYYQEEISQLLKDYTHFPFDNLGVSQTVIIYGQFIDELKQLL